MSRSLEDRVALITAAASGMGRESALRFAAEGAAVVALDIDQDAGNALSKEIGDAGGSCEFIRYDLLDLGGFTALAQHVESRFGRLDVLFNHAGAPGPRGFEFSAADWDRAVALNVSVPIFLTQAMLPSLRKASHGSSVIFTSSISGIVASVNSPVYSAVKAAVIGFMRSVAAVGGKDGIRANVIAPGATETPMLNKFFGADGASAEVIEDRVSAFSANVPLGRLARPEEIAEVALFLAGPKSSYVSGAVIPIDGGYSAI